ncbi:uncharacterized protein LOC117639443 isoform X1 [Thrips palmi]|uniref:Uncharacterized protein LOC117639443 isoform X1 n=1 Tax=Thrips palmi TaxID=161013 RepID=A0A6P8ZGZ9_THRPL|nr:uncharacterized protein LOC117639443 isoform X1 [Thrips palmi]
MDPSGSDNSISKNISIPQWMRPRMQDGFDTEISSISPPNQDDSFFYIPYSKLTKANPPGPAIACTSSENSPSIGTFSGSGASGSSSLANKHTSPCLKFLGEGKNMDIADLTGFSKDDKKISKPVKSFGTDDGFKSEAAQCGHSVVQVAQQMIADRLIGRPNKFHNDSDKNNLGDPEIQYLKQRVRRGSKSLPASPLSTPDSTPQIHRKNRFFTGAFVETPEESSRQFPGSWLVAGLLGVQRENFSESQNDLASDSNNNASLQTKKAHSPDALRRNNSSSMILQSLDKSKSETGGEGKDKNASHLHESRSAASLIKIGNAGTDNTGKKPRPKPSELREMNFWSPTSM